MKSMTEEAVDAVSFNADFEKLLSPKTELFYGVEYVYNKVKSTGEESNIETNETAPTVSRYPNGSTWQSMAAYTNVKFKPSEKFVLQTGLRYNYMLMHADFSENNQYLNLPFNKTNLNYDALTGSAVISCVPNNILQWKLNFSTAFSAPNIEEIKKTFVSEPGYVVLLNLVFMDDYVYGN